jgi:putrescine aminotransferase
MQVLPFYNSFFNTTNVPAVKLAARLAELAPERFEHVFFTSSGSEANDTALRMVWRYWQIMGQPQRQLVISRRNAYHGSTVAGASLGGMAGMHAQGALPIPGIHHIEQPNFAELGRGMGEAEFGLVAARWLEEKILELGPERVAAFIGEPVQGAGGVIIPPATYWPEIQRICDRYGILLVSDEVICGFGRLGTWFGCELMGTRPDLIPFAKGVTSGYVPLGGVLVGSRVADALIERGGDFNHGFTYSGHPVACAAALENLRILQEEGLVERVAQETGPWLKAAFGTLAAHPLVGHAETCGLTAGLNLVRGLPGRAGGGHAVPRAHVRQRRHHARGGRPDDRGAAAGDDHGADRRDGGADPVLPGSDAGRRAAAGMVGVGGYATNLGSRAGGDPY